MGSGYVSNSCTELFEENLADYPVLLPMSFDEEPEALRHLRLHNGTIWRWNRALIGSDEDGAPHLRIEHRILPAGPTILDMIANAALYVGLAHDLASSGAARELSFDAALKNFYSCPRATDLAPNYIGPEPAPERRESSCWRFCCRRLGAGWRISASLRGLTLT